ncbi:DUF2975 domain-containing protein [Flavobacterium gelatinilyticum]|mgnify:CR=1 FL=1|uniref:DUF2975 domain-containing protein n=1 Tax=Flavobacterium gelatinilyticum TaxID=3003260 RepID=UPI002480E9AF|nr:DUF2975 domain-containing protein [Flavobacterium gelatinilyticum]
MKTNKRLLTTLYIISRISLRITQLIFLLAVFFEFTPKGGLGHFSSTMHHSKGYPVDVKIQLNIPDTLINYRNNNENGLIIKSNNQDLQERFNKIKTDTLYSKTFQINRFEVYDNKYHEIKKEIVRPTVQYKNSEIEIILNPKDSFFKCILILKNYLSLILIMFVSLQFMRLFKELRTNFVFNDLLKKRIKNIGYSLIAYQIVNFIASLITMQYLSIIKYYHYLPNIAYSTFNFMNLTSTPEYNITILFLGLCCLVLARLLKYGSDLQNENELTI